MNDAALRHERLRDIGNKAVEEVEEASLAETLGEGRRGFHIDEQQRALLDAGPAVAAGDEIKQHALAEQDVHTIEEIWAETHGEREDDAAAIDQEVALNEAPQEPRAWRDPGQLQRDSPACAERDRAKTAAGD